MIRLTWETEKLLHKLERIRLKAVPYAVAMAMTWTAQAAAKAFGRDLAEKLDNPTPFTLGAPRFRPANKAKTEYDVYVRDEASKGNAPSKYLLALMQGGYRRNKGSENALRRVGILPPGFQVQPGEDAPLNQYGNLSGGKYVQILSALKAMRETGYTANRTERSEKRRAKSLVDYFVLYSIKLKSPTGVYTRRGKRILQILTFTPKRSRYDKILDLKATVAKIWDTTFETNLREGLRRMIEKVKSW